MMYQAFHWPHLFVMTFRALPGPAPLALLTYQGATSGSGIEAEELPLGTVPDERFDLAGILMSERGSSPPLTWQEWQFIALEILRRHGFAVVEPPTPQGYGGPDGVVAFKGLPPYFMVESKHYKNVTPISRVDIQQLVQYCRRAQTPFGIILTTSADIGRGARESVGEFQRQGFRFFLFKRRDIEDYMMGLEEGDPLRRALRMALDATEDWT